MSKVTGKHLPAKPSTMLNTYKDLANLIPKSSEPTLFIGFAEAATALGQGVYEAYNMPHSFYMHSTRFSTSHKKWFTFLEEHSHAPNHIFYEPINQKLKKIMEKVTRIILIDDEISTGNTANNIIKELKIIFPTVKTYLLVSILDWSNRVYDNFESLALHKGSFTFTDKRIDITDKIISEPKIIKNLDTVIPYNFARYGIQHLNINVEKYVNIEEIKNKKILILGTAEFMYPPYLLAQYIENKGIECYFQATTRSPINIDGEIVSKITFIDNYFENIDNFLYNVIDKDYDKVFICYETKMLPQAFNLADQLRDKFDVEEIYFHV